ncbi:MAG: hypothetical protein ACXWPO_08115 [Candidatus Limnocylindrales bacterium]
MRPPPAEQREGMPVREAARLLARLGFEVVHGDQPWLPSGANLIVALRATPTLEHFDPERVSYWEARGGRGRLAELSREQDVPFHAPFAWGTLRVTDRLEETNAFLTFGGLLRVEALDPLTTIGIFGSPAPIVRWSGHSQPIDELTGHVGAFFARLMIPIDYTPGAEARVAAASPTALYAAFVTDLHERLEATEAVATGEAGLTGWVEREMARLTEAMPDQRLEGAQLLTDLGLAGPEG